MNRLLAARLEVPFWCSFRSPYAANVHLTYSVPPPATLKGMLAAAMGYPADYLGPLTDLPVGVGIEDQGEKIETLSQIIKWDWRNYSKSRFRMLVIREKIIKPTYYFYVRGPEELLSKIAVALTNPFFPLALGESDDAVEVTDVNIVHLQEDKSSVVHNCLPLRLGTPIERVNVERLATGWEAGPRNSTGVVYEPYCIAPQIRLEKAIPTWQYGPKRVVV
ncbi:MAG TPA: CRISPR-associated protein Cas5 [Firmicutes bacterium]|nr:CRISPR-associated protein Cas5 [Bacillota bacterium]